MAVTSLTGTTWIINETPTAPSESFECKISFTSNNINFGGTGYGFQVYVSGRIDYDTTTVYTTPVWGSGGWSDQAYRTVTFTSEVDDIPGLITQTEFISWLEANATQVIHEPEYVDKVSLISGDEYYIKDTISGYLTKEDILSSGTISISETSEGRLSINDTSTGIAGRFIRFRTPSIIEGKYWVIEDPTFSTSMNKTWNINITPGWWNSVQFNGMKFDSSTGNISLENGSIHDAIYNYDDVRYDLYLNSTWNSLMEANVNGSTETMTSDSPEYIYISGGTDASDPTFIDWVLTHAVQVHPLLTSTSTSVVVPAGTKLRLLGFNVLRYQEDTTFSFNFTSNSVNYTGILYSYSDGQSEYYYIKSSGNTYITNYYTIITNTDNAIPEYGFQNSAYRDLLIADQFTASNSTHAILTRAVVLDN